MKKKENEKKKININKKKNREADNLPVLTKLIKVFCPGLSYVTREMECVSGSSSIKSQRELLYGRKGVALPLITVISFIWFSLLTFEL